MPEGFRAAFTSAAAKAVTVADRALEVSRRTGAQRVVIDPKAPPLARAGEAVEVTIELGT